MKNSKVLMGTAPFLAMMMFLFMSAALNSAKASTELNTGKFRAPLEMNQGSAENNTFSSDRKKKKKKKKKGHRCEAY